VIEFSLRLGLISDTHISKEGERLPWQVREIFEGVDIVENLLLGCHHFMKTNFLSAGIFWGLAQKREIRLREWVEEIINFLELERYRKQIAGMLPIGVQKLEGLGRALSMKPRLLLIDEVSSLPTVVQNDKQRNV